MRCFLAMDSIYGPCSSFAYIMIYCKRISIKHCSLKNKISDVRFVKIFKLCIIIVGAWIEYIC